MRQWQRPHRVITPRAGRACRDIKRNWPWSGIQLTDDEWFEERLKSGGGAHVGENAPQQLSHFRTNHALALEYFWLNFIRWSNGIGLSKASYNVIDMVMMMIMKQTRCLPGLVKYVSN